MASILNNTRERGLWTVLGGAPTLALGVVLGVGAFLRLWRLGDTPVWYVDEFVHLELARNLLEGEARVGALRVDWFGTIAHPPLYFLLGAVSIGLFGDSIASLRAVTASAGIVSIGLLFGVGRLLRGRCMGLLAAATYAVLPTAVMIDRRAYSYPLALMLALALALAVLHFHRTGRRASLYAGSALLSCLLVTGYYAAPLALVFAIFVLLHDRSRALQHLAIALALPLACLAVFWLPRWEPALFALHFELARAATSTGAGTALLATSLELGRQELLLALAAVGVVCLRGARAAWLGAIFVALSGFLLLRRPEIGSVHYPAGAFLGFLALPFAGLFLLLRDLGLGAVRGPAARAAVLAVSLGLPSALLAARAVDLAPAVWAGALETPLSRRTDRSLDLHAVRAYLASVVRPGELVASNYTVSHGLPVRRTDLVQIYAYETGRETPFSPGYLPSLPDFRRQLFAFDCSLERLDYLVLSRVDWRWTLQQPFARELLGAGAGELHAIWTRQHRAGVRDIVLPLRGQTWPVIHRSGDILVLRNPARGP